MTKKQLKLYWIEVYRKGHIPMSKLLEKVPEIDTNEELKAKLNL